MAVCAIRSVPRPSRIADSWAYLTDCYTRPTHRDRGVGTKLLSYVIAWARTQDFEMMLVWPSERSGDFYARGGFEGDAEVRILHLRDFDALSTELCSPP